MSNLKDEAYKLISEGRKAEFKNYYTEAEKNYEEALQIWNKIEEYDEYRAYPYYSLAILYRKMGDYQKSLYNFGEAEKILVSAREEFKFLLSAIYTNTGNLFKGYGDYSKALSYYNKAIEVIQSTPDRNETVYADILLNISQTYYYMHKYQISIDICMNYIKSPNSIDHSRFERLIGSSLIALEQYDKAKEMLEQSLKGYKDEPERYIEAFLIGTKAYIRSGDLSVAEEKLRTAIPLLSAYKPKNDQWNIYYYELKGEYYVKKAQASYSINDKQKYLSDALKVIDKALLMNSISKEENKIPYIDCEGDFITPTQVKDLMISRAKILNDISKNYQTLNDKISERQFQLLSLKTWEAIVRFLYDFRASFLEEESKLTLSEMQAEVYFEGFMLSSKLYHETGKEDYFNKMLFFSESGKSSTFLASLNAAQAKNFGGIPDSLLAREKELNMQLTSMNQMIYNVKNSSNPDTILLKEWQKNQFNTQKQYDELIFKFEKDFPNYYMFKYSDKLITIAELRKKLQRNQALVEYFVNEPSNNNEKGSVNILYFTTRGYKVYQKEISYGYINNLKTVLEQLTNHDVGETNLNDFKHFVNASNYLYSVLIEPIEFEKSTTDLIIIPDGKLAYLSFDALITHLPDSSKISFSSPEYLVRHFNFTYSYSATLHYEYFRNYTNSNSKILAFAPEYAGIEIDLNKAAYRARQGIRTMLRPLPGAREEVIGLSKHFKCQAYTGNDATEKCFKEKAAHYGILHLAMHTMMNDSIPMYSKLVFSPDTDSTEDGFLNTQEIYNMKIDARLAVLSACNTGSGQMRTGEGVMSMARAFLYAGCPSIVMTLWEVEDKSSATLILNFYRYLFKGYSKPEALRRSKLDYLRGADPLKSHPYFWMGYIVVGDPSPIKYHTSVIVSIIIFGFIITVMLIFGKRLIRIVKDAIRNR